MEPQEEQDRREIFAALERVLGAEIARRFMAYMPIVPWQELATKADLAALEGRMDQRFDLVDQRFEEVDQRFEEVDQRFDLVDQRFEEVDQRFEQMNQRFDGLHARMDGSDERMDRLPTHTDLEAMEHRLVAVVRGEIVAAVTSQTRTMMFGLVGTVVTLAGFMLAALQLA